MDCVVTTLNNLQEEMLSKMAETFDRIFSSENGSASEERLRLIRDSILKHSTRQGFRCAVALDQECIVIGFAYGYFGAHGQWWYERVKQVLGEERSMRWLEDYFELVELAVEEKFRRSGIATRLYSELFAGLENCNALLSTEMANIPALRLYTKLGWKTIAENVRFSENGEEFVIMGKCLSENFS